MTRVISHRGLHHNKEYSENTIPAIQAAFDEGVDAVEIDVRLTSDQVWVVHHDPWVHEEKHQISQMSYNDLMELVNQNGLELNTLKEVIDTFRDKSLLIECKPKSKNAGKLLGEMIVDEGFIEKCEISSFSQKALIGARSISDRLSLSLLGIYITKQEWRQLNEKIDLYGLHINQKFAVTDTIHFIQESGIKFYAWTVNDEETIEKLISYRVDGIISDNPSTILEMKTQTLT